MPPGAAGPESPAAPARGPPAPQSREGHEGAQGVIFSSSSVLDLSQSDLHHLGAIFKIPSLEVRGRFIGCLCFCQVNVRGFYLDSLLKRLFLGWE